MREKLRLSRQIRLKGGATCGKANGLTTVEEMAEIAVLRWARTEIEDARKAEANEAYRIRQDALKGTEPRTIIDDVEPDVRASR